jgi:hypothetical protein
VNDLAFLVRVVDDYYLGQLASDTVFAVQEDQFLAGSAGWSGWPAYTMTYPGSGVSQLEHLDRGGEATGTKQVMGVRYDPLTGIITQMVDNPSTLTALANQLLPGDPSAILEGGFHNVPSAPENSWWKQQYSEAAVLQSGVAVTVTGPDRIHPGALLTLNTGLSTDPMAGTYQIAHAYTEIIGGQATTRLEMRRAQINVAGTGTAPGVSPSTSTGSTSVGTGGAVIPVQSGGG